MANNVDLSSPTEAIGDLLEALTWCGWRIAQGLQEVSSASGVVAVGPPVGDVAADPPASP